MTRRKSRRKWWGRRPFRAPTYKTAYRIHDFENEVITRKVRELEPGNPAVPVWAFTAESLLEVYPDLFDPRNLRRALRRMRRQGVISGGRFLGKIYVLDDRRDEEAKAA